MLLHLAPVVCSAPVAVLTLCNALEAVLFLLFAVERVALLVVGAGAEGARHLFKLHFLGGGKGMCVRGFERAGVCLRGGEACEEFFAEGGDLLFDFCLVDFVVFQLELQLQALYFDCPLPLMVEDALVGLPVFRGCGVPCSVPVLLG